MVTHQTGQKVTGFGLHHVSMTTTTAPIAANPATNPAGNPATNPATELAPGQCYPGDPRAFFAKAVEIAGIAIAAVRPEQMEIPTPCDQYDVRGLIGHLMMAIERAAIVGRDENPFAVGDEMEPLADDAWSAAWQNLALQVNSAWANDATLLRPTALPWAPLSGAQALGTYTSELTVHTWDLATATGQSPEWDNDTLAAGLAAMHGALPAVGRPEMFAAIRAQMGFTENDMTDPYGPAVPVAADAPLIDQLVAYNGRAPR